MVREGDLTCGGDHTIQCTDAVITLLTNVTTIKSIKKTRDTSVAVDLEKREPSCPVGAAAMENNMEIPQKKELNRTKNRTTGTYDPAILLLSIYIKEIYQVISKNLYLHIYCIIIYNSQDMETI